MRRASLVLALSVALVLPTSAGAVLVGKFAGPVDNGGTVEFKLLKNNNGKKQVKDWTWNDVPVDCSSGGPSSSGVFTFPMKVKQGEFRGTGILGPPGNPDARVKVKGAIQGPDASGTIKISGDIPEGNNCESGKEDWDASKI